MTKRYSLLEHLACSLWLNHDPEIAQVAVFTAYFDASGNHPGSKVVVVAGFVSTVKKWLRFEDDWLAFLEKNHTEPPFHMADFVTGKSRKYRDWKGDKDEFVAKAVSLIRQRTNCSFAHGILVDDLERLFREYDIKALPPEPYAWCGAIAIGRLDAWLRKPRPGRNRVERLAVFFEDGDMDKGKFMDYARVRFRILPKFIGKEDTDGERAIPLQACDMLGWIVRRSIIDIPIYGDRTHVLGSREVARLLPPHALGYHNYAGLEATALELGLTQRANGAV